MTNRLWYAQQTIANGWSRSVLEHWIESDLHSRQGKAVTNFKQALPAPQSDLANELVRDPYLAKVHGITNVAMVEKGYIGSGSAGRSMPFYCVLSGT